MSRKVSFFERAIAVALAILLPSQVAFAAYCNLVGETRPRQIIGNACGIPSFPNAAVGDFEQQAIANVLATHGLPASDYDTVKAWARDDVRAQEWVDLLRIINLPASGRTPNEQAVYDWFQTAYKTQIVDQARKALNEYRKWSGRDLGDLHEDPLNYGGQQIIDGVAYDTGYCNYSPPDGSSDHDFTFAGRKNQLCYTSCTNPLGCAPTYPSVEDFQAFGLYSDLNPTIGNTDFTNAQVGVYGAIGIGASLAATGVAVPLAISIGASSGALAGSAIQSAIFPFAARVSYVAVRAVGTAAATASRVASASAITAGAVTYVVGTAIFAAVTISLEIVKLVQNAAVPTRLEDALTKAQGTTVDLHAMLAPAAGSENQQRAYQALYTLFMSKTMPDVDPDGDCSGNNGNLTKPCAHQAPPPAFNPTTDPAFLVWTEEASGWVPRGLQTSIYSSSPTYPAFVSTYMSGNGWFVSTKYDSSNPANLDAPTGAPGAKIQTLRLPYRNWQGQVWVASRVKDNQGLIRFATAPLDASQGNPCAQSGTSGCITDRLDYLQANGKKAIAVIVPANTSAPVVSANVPSIAYYRQPTRVSAEATPGVGGVPPFTYRWNGSIEGAQVDLDWRAVGPTTVTLDVTDAQGRKTSRSWSVQVIAPTSIRVRASQQAPYAFGTPVVFTAVIDSQSNFCSVCEFPEGHVQFFVDGAPVGAPVPTTQGFEYCDAGGCFNLENRAESAPIVLDPTPFPEDPSATVSGHVVSAQYFPSTDLFAGSSGQLVGLVVGGAETRISLTSPDWFANPLTLVATVAPDGGLDPGIGVPSGNVLFRINGEDLGLAPLDPTGRATVTAPHQAAAPFKFKAGYSGDNRFGAAVYYKLVEPVALSVSEVSFPDANEDGSFRLVFSDDVRAVKGRTVRLIDGQTGKTVATKSTCFSSVGGPKVNCLRGPVREVALVPRKPLKTWWPYNVEATSGVVGHADETPLSPFFSGWTSSAEISPFLPTVSYTWATIADPTALGGSYLFEEYPGASQSFTARGSQVGVVTLDGPDGGKATVWVETPGYPLITQEIDTYNPVWGPVSHPIANLPKGEHVFTVVVQGERNEASSGQRIRLDGISLGKRVVATPKTVARWPNFPGGFVYSATPQATASFKFYGQEPYVIWQESGFYGGYFGVTIDGVPAFVSASWGPTPQGWVGYSYGPVEPGWHTLTVTSLTPEATRVAIQMFGILY